MANAPHTVVADITAVVVNITTTPKVSIKIGSAAFTQGQKVDFTNAVTFSLTPEGGASKNYTLAITPYNADSNPYGIYTVAHLSDVRNAVSDNFKLMNDLTMPNADAAGAAATGIADYADAGWLPIANLTSDQVNEGKGAFTGKLDGGSHKIDNFYAKRATDAVGLFGCVWKGASIKSLGVNGGTNGISGNSAAGMLAGYSRGTIENCYTTGNVSATATASSPSSIAIAGGLVGSGDGTISHCYTTGNVSSSSASSIAAAGGLVGKCYQGTISHCYTTGNVSVSAVADSFAGGLVGSCGGDIRYSINYCYVTGNVSGSGSAFGSNLGGLVGRYNSEKISFQNCYRNSDASIKKSDQVATPKDASVAGITAKTLVEMKTDAFKELLGNSVWGRAAGKNSDLPYLIGVGVGG